MTVYGIDVIDSHGKTIRSVSNIFLSKEKAEKLIAVCNTLKLSLVHLNDVIYDCIE